MEYIERTIETVPEKTTWQERLSGFALSHFLISVFGFLAGIVCLALDNVRLLEFAFCAGTGILLLLYMAAGFYVARDREWSTPAGGKDGFFAILRPTLIAWMWGGLLLVSSSLRWLDGLSAVMIMASVALASPSVLVVLVSAMIGLFDLGVLGYLIGLFLAGGLPPLLFFLGSLLGAKTNVVADAPAEKTECDGDV